MPRMPKSTTSTPVGRDTRRRPARTPNPSSPRNTLPIPADQHPQRHDLLGREEEPVPALAEVAARVVVDQHADEHAALHVASRPTSTTAVLPASARSKTSPPARGRSFTRVPTGSPTASTAAPRSVPRCAPGSRACAGRARISAFSSSVSARMFSASSPSISPPSNRSPGDSGAIRGWSSRMIGDESIASSPTSTGQRADVLAAGRLGRGDEAPAAQQRVRRAERVPQRLLAVARPPTASCCAIVTVSRGPSTIDARRRPRSARERERPGPTATLVARSPVDLQEAHGHLDVVRIALAAAPACASRTRRRDARAVHAGGKTPPNVQRRWFFSACGGTARACSPRT